MIEIRSISEDEVVAFRGAVDRGFGNDPHDAPDLAEQFMSTFPLGDTLAALDDGQIVATFASLPFEVNVPGGAAVAMAGTTVVTVFPTHRRQGILTELMGAHLRQAGEQGLPVAGLWASDERIYGRFGYGPATYGLEIDFSSEIVDVAPRPAGIGYRLLTVDEEAETIPGIYEQARLAGRPGMLTRSPAWWRSRHLADSPHRRRGATARRTVVARRDGEPVGYVTYRQREDWTKSGASGKAQIVEMVALDDDARRALWSYVANVDLYPNVQHWCAPVDDPLVAEVARFRHLKQQRIDGMWLRPLDVTALLEARRYERDGHLVIEVVDGFCGRGGRFGLEAVDGNGSCPATTAPAEVTIDVADLGSLYLGSGSARMLARAGRIEGDPRAVATLDELFNTVEAPHCLEVF